MVILSCREFWSNYYQVDDLTVDSLKTLWLNCVHNKVKLQKQQ